MAFAVKLLVAVQDERRAADKVPIALQLEERGL